MSHKLRAALTSICAFAELKEFCSQEPLIRLGAEHLNALLTEILDPVKIDAAAMPNGPE